MNWSHLPVSWPAISSAIIATVAFFYFRSGESSVPKHEAPWAAGKVLAASLLILVTVGWMEANWRELEYRRCVAYEPYDSWIEWAEEGWIYPCHRHELRYRSGSRLYRSPSAEASATNERRRAELFELMPY